VCQEAEERGPILHVAGRQLGQALAHGRDDLLDLARLRRALQGDQGPQAIGEERAVFGRASVLLHRGERVELHSAAGLIEIVVSVVEQRSRHHFVLGRLVAREPLRFQARGDLAGRRCERRSR
jgi:hypothetical protein